MKCNECLNLREQYIDGEASARDAERVGTHLITCTACAREFEMFTAEQEIYARYDRELEIPPSMWGVIEARIVKESVIEKKPRAGLGEWIGGLFTLPRSGFAFSGALALLVIALAAGVIYLRNHRASNPSLIAGNERVNPVSPPINMTGVGNPPAIERTGTVILPVSVREKTSKVGHVGKKKAAAGDQGGVLFTDAAYTDIEERDTANHLEQAQNLLVSFRSIKSSDDDEEIDVTYEKSESRRLLNENIVLRRDAEMAGKFPAKSVLGSLEPFLIDIANLPDKAAASDVRQIKQRVEKTEIVAELRSY